LKKPELKPVKIITRVEPFPLDKVKVSLHYFFEPVAYAVLCGKNEQRKGGETYKGNDYKFCIDGSK
jgi:hypothetical protein